MKSTI